MIHIVKGFSVASESEVDIFWNFLVFSMIQEMLALSSLVNSQGSPGVLGPSLGFYTFQSWLLGL